MLSLLPQRRVACWDFRGTPPVDAAANTPFTHTSKYKNEERVWRLRQMKLSEVDISAQNMRLHRPAHPNTQPFHFLSPELQELLPRLKAALQKHPCRLAAPHLHLF